MSQVSEWTEELQKTLKVVREERDGVRRQLDKEKQLLKEARKIKEALEEKTAQLENENEGSNFKR